MMTTTSAVIATMMQGDSSDEDEQRDLEQAEDLAARGGSG
jgi:hypothetical protein